jgi:hypothetical protein
MFSFASFSQAIPQIRTFLQGLPAGSQTTAGLAISSVYSQAHSTQTSGSSVSAGSFESALPTDDTHYDRLEKLYRRSERRGRRLTYSGELRHGAV